MSLMKKVELMMLYIEPSNQINQLLNRLSHEFNIYDFY